MHSASVAGDLDIERGNERPVGGGFGAGAMEIVGAITYKDALLLVDSKNASYDTKQSVASVIAHEMAHQCFVEGYGAG